MRALRRKIGQLNEKCYAASQARQPAVEAMQNAQMALNNCSKANLKIVKRECKRRERQAKRANERYAVLDQGSILQTGWRGCPIWVGGNRLCGVRDIPASLRTASGIQRSR